MITKIRWFIADAFLTFGKVLTGQSKQKVGRRYKRWAEVNVK